jgi:hypothetical protein
MVSGAMICYPTYWETITRTETIFDDLKQICRSASLIAPKSGNANRIQMVFEVGGTLVLGKMEIDTNVYRWVTRNWSKKKINGHRLKSPAVSEDVKPEDAGWDKESSTTKVPTEMVHTSLPSAPPSSPNLSPFEHFDPSDAQELAQAVKDMQMAPNCTCSHTPREDASEATSTYGPPTFPTSQPSPQFVTTEHAQQFFDLLQSLSTKQGLPPPPAAAARGGSEEAPARASKLEFKAVNEVCVFRANPNLMELIPFIQLGRKGIQVQDRGINHAT